MRSLYRNNGKQIHVPAGFSNLDDGRQARKPAAYHDDFGCYCHKPFLTTKDTKGHKGMISALLCFA
jgi:hypothetical protein